MATHMTIHHPSARTTPREAHIDVCAHSNARFDMQIRDYGRCCVRPKRTNERTICIRIGKPHRNTHAHIHNPPYVCCDCGRREADTTMLYLTNAASKYTGTRYIGIAIGRTGRTVRLCGNPYAFPFRVLQIECAFSMYANSHCKQHVCVFYGA